ncbi:MAG: arginyltransferase [Alphaproteobacteria bacterium]|nr:arginyltransferase [Alphaproteobacteria bacterium]
MSSVPLVVFYGTAPQPCPYLDGRIESKIVTELTQRDATGLHDRLVVAGFRRSHKLAYRPACRGCDACVPVRVPVARFQPSRTQRRIARRNADLMVEELPARASSEQYALFRRYQRSRHHDGGMALMGARDYRDMVEETAVETRIVEFRALDGRLVAVSLSDRIADGLSGVYQFFDPDEPQRSPGVAVILWHIARARALGLPYVYLGYWIADCAKMAYKNAYRPIEALGPAGWRELTDAPDFA